MIRAIIIDDEERARRVMQNLLEEYCEDVEIIASCKSVPDAVIQINQQNPDVVFCDIEMPDYNGFELLSFFKDVEFELVFATGYSEYAIRAFEVSAVDYLLKPIQIDALQNAIEKIKERLQHTTMHDRLETLKENLKDQEIQKIALPVSDGLIFVNVKDISLIEADRAYSHVWLNDGSNILVSRRLKFFEDLLEGKSQFIRVHRSNIININYVKKYSRSEGFIFLDNNKSVRVARDKKAEFEDFIKEIRL